ncbi:MAG: hypothetical protein ACO1OX_13855 [Novosphingobium sp.]
MPRRRAIAVKIHCPISPSTLAAMLSGNAEAIEADAAASAMLAVIRADNPLGDFDLYKGVCEISVGWESFQPGPGATPTLGASGTRTLSPTAILTTYAKAEADTTPVLAELIAAHPWEVPVIEVFETELLVR